mgnify:CR=1 FL=1
MAETEAAEEARLRQRKTMLEKARRAEQKRLKELDPAFIEKKRLNLEMKEQKAAVQAGKKRGREEKREEKARLEQQKKDEHAASSKPRFEDKNSRVGGGEHRSQWVAKAAEVTSRSARDGIHTKGSTRCNCCDWRTRDEI